MAIGRLGDVAGQADDEAARGVIRDGGGAAQSTWARFLSEAQSTSAEGGFDAWIEKRCAGMLLVGNFEGIASQRGIAWHSAAALATIREPMPYRTYIPEPERKHDCCWTDKPPQQKEAVYANRRRTRGTRGKQLQRLRNERVERSFAHVCETGGSRRTWLWGLDKLRKRYQIAAAAHNLGIVMRKLFGIGTPRGLQVFVDLAAALYLLPNPALATQKPNARQHS